MSKQLLVDCIAFEYVKDNLFEEAVRDQNRRLVVKGILQRAKVKNQNGRVYPRDTLFRESKKYEENFIKERRALGELDHPECLKNTAKILTKCGWKFIKDISNNEEILTLNLETNKPEYQNITKKIDQPYSGSMYHFKGKNLDVWTTPNHRFVIEDRYGKLIFKTAEELYELNNKVISHLKIPKSNSCWEVESPSFFILKGCSTELFNKSLKKELLYKYTQDIQIPFDLWMSFIGIYLSEGHTEQTRRDGKKSKRKSFRIIITQKHKEKTEKIKELLLKFPEDLKWTCKTNKKGKTKFSISDARLFNYLYPLGSCYDKCIPVELKNQSASLLELLLEWYHIGDGRDVWYKGYNTKNIFSTSKKLMEDFQEIQLKIGGNGNIVEDVCKKDYKFAEHIIKKKNKQTLYTLKFNTTKYIHIDNRFLEITKEDFNDRVYCVQVPNQTFYCEENGKCFWSGNSSVVNLQNVSHNVIEMHWEGDDLIGTIEVLPTPNGNILKELFKANIRLGISSRGLGTVNKGISEGTDADVVQDDFELIAFDFVSNPSTRGAFMFPAGNLQEGLKNVVQNPINHKWERVENIVRDILTEIG